MAPDLTDADKQRFEKYKERLEGVDRAPPPSRDQVSEFTPLDPMLAESFSGDLATFDESNWIAERKFDGTRILLEKFDGEVRLFTRRHVERSDSLPGIAEAARSDLPDGLIVDGEAAYVDADQNTYFVPIHGGTEKIRDRDLEEQFFAFDILVEDREWVTDDPLMTRKDRLTSVVPGDGTLQIEDYTESDFQDLFDRLVERGEEGIMLKRRNSLYRPGTRSSNWRKVKHFTVIDAIVVGYTQGDGERADTFGALVLSDGEQYLGNVGSGFSDAELELLSDTFSEPTAIPIERTAVDQPFTPVDPLVVTVKFQDITDDMHLRAPVFRSYHPEKPPESVRPLDEQVPDRA